MLDVTVPKTRTPRTRTAAAKAKPLTFAEVGRAAAKAAQRDVLLAACETHGWNLTAVGEALGMGTGAGASAAVIRALKALASEEYEAAKADGRIKHYRPKG